MIRLIEALPWLVCTTILFGCTYQKRVTANPAAQGVQILTSAPSGCRQLGDVIASARVEGDETESVAEARTDLRNKTHQLGGTHVHVQTSESRPMSSMMGSNFQTTMSGIAYACVPGSPAQPTTVSSVAEPAPAAAPPAPAAQPAQPAATPQPPPTP
jgi:hypothetical protein